MTITLIAKRDEVPKHKMTGYMSGTYTIETVTNSLLTTTNAEANGFTVGGLTLQQKVVLNGDGTITIYPGFVPKYVRVASITSRIQKEWFEGMNSVDSLLTIANGTRTLVTTSGVVVTSGAATGTAPVTYEPAPSITIDASVDTLIADNDTWVWEVTG